MAWTRCLLVACIGLSGLLAVATPAAASTCPVTYTPCQAFRSPAVFVGTVLRVQEGPRGRVHRVRVGRAVKGRHRGVVEVRTTGMHLRLDVGGRYVIVAANTNGPVELHDCSPLIPIPPGEPEPELPPVDGHVYGRVHRDVFAIRSPRPVAGVRVWLDLPAGRVTALSDRFGRFQLAGVPPGDYPLGVESHAFEPSWPSRVVVRPTDGCVLSDVSVRPSARVSGRVVHRDGQPAAQVPVTLLDVDRPATYGVSVVSDVDGAFAVRGVEAGTYRLALNPGGPSIRTPYPTTWFGAMDEASATRIHVEEGRAVRLARPFIVPRRMPLREVTVSVTCRDGSVPPFLEVVAGPADRAGIELKESATGPVTLTLLPDRAYTIKATPSISFGAQGPRDAFPRGGVPPLIIPAGGARRSEALVAPYSGCGVR